jgi:hypothetical protein
METYTLEDFTADCDKMRAFEDVGIDYLGGFDVDQDVLLKNYLKTQRFLRFADEALEKELVRGDPATQQSEPNISHQPVASISEFLDCMPLEYVAEDVPGIERYNASSSSSTTFSQEKKDIERDKYLLNGVFFVGGPSSDISEFMSMLGTTIDKVLAEAKVIEFSHIRKRFIINSVVRNVCRTHCGGVSYAVLQHACLLCSQEHAIVPLSSEVSPIKLRVSIGGLQDLKESHNWGLRIDVEADSFYALKDLRNLDTSSESQPASPNAVRVRFSMSIGSEINYSRRNDDSEVWLSSRIVSLNACVLKY